jgi:predicted kinase
MFARGGPPDVFVAADGSVGAFARSRADTRRTGMIHPMAARLVLGIPDPSLVVLIGAAGAGKSTFAARHFAPGEVLSSDAYRALIAGDPADQRATAPAFAALHRDLARRLGRRELTVVDATNVTRTARRRLLDIAARAGVPAVAVVLEPAADTVLARNAGRGDRVVPEPAVRRQLAELARTLAPGWLEHEGFATVMRLPSPGAVDEVEIERHRD